eukprot:3012-Eustigmatos_ZCMA.PRE.1
MRPSARPRSIIARVERLTPLVRTAGKEGKEEKGLRSPALMEPQTRAKQLLKLLEEVVVLLLSLK